jgi:hypothetical protein
MRLHQSHKGENAFSIEMDGHGNAFDDLIFSLNLQVLANFSDVFSISGPLLDQKRIFSKTSDFVVLTHGNYRLSNSNRAAVHEVEYRAEYIAIERS